MGQGDTIIIIEHLFYCQGGLAPIASPIGWSLAAQALFSINVIPAHAGIQGRGEWDIEFTEAGKRHDAGSGDMEAFHPQAAACGRHPALHIAALFRHDPMFSLPWREGVRGRSPKATRRGEGMRFTLI